jgi:TPR repeat protein
MSNALSASLRHGHWLAGAIPRVAGLLLMAAALLPSPARADVPAICGPAKTQWDAAIANHNTAAALAARKRVMGPLKDACPLLHQQLAQASVPHADPKPPTPSPRPSVAAITDPFKLEQLAIDAEAAKDLAKSTSLYRDACNAKLARACTHLGLHYRDGTGVEKDNVAAATWSEIGCDRGDAPGCTQAGLVVNQGTTSAEKQRARLLFARACDQHHGLGCKKLGDEYYDGTSVAKDMARVRSLWTMACDYKELGGCIDMGEVYAQGLGVDRDYAKSATFFKAACDKNHARSCNTLGGYYESAKGVGQDYAQALQLYTRACDASGGSYGCYGEGVLYYRGKGVTRDNARARPLFDKGCNAKVARACDYLGGMFWTGEGSEPDFKRAGDAWERGCELRDGDSCRDASLPFKTGKGRDRDLAKMRDMLVKSCNMDSVPGCEDLAKSYFEGTGGPVSITSARDTAAKLHRLNPKVTIDITQNNGKWTWDKRTTS